MLVFYSLTLLIVAAIIANILYTIFPSLPLTFYQIGCGFLLSLLPFFQNYSLEPEIFMLMVIAPLMFNDGQNTSASYFRHSIRQILNLAVILAVVTAVIIGLVAHLLLPLIPLALCFAVAAIVKRTLWPSNQSLKISNCRQTFPVHWKMNPYLTMLPESLSSI